MRDMPPRPFAPERRGPQLFVPAPEVVSWATAAFIGDDASMRNPDHDHLDGAVIVALWAHVPSYRYGGLIAAQAETPFFKRSTWRHWREIDQFQGWFGLEEEDVDFVLTFDAGVASDLNHLQWCALVEHELYHCGQALDQWGAPKFRMDGRPAYSIRGHDVEQFVGVVERYGIDADGGRTRRLVRAAERAPMVGAAEISHLCGSCGGRV